ERVRVHDEEYLVGRLATVDLVHQLAQYGGKAVGIAILGDEVDVLKHDHGRLEVASHVAKLAGMEQSLAANKAHGKLRQPPCEVEADRGLARARQAMEEDATFHLDAQCYQRVPVAVEAKDRAVDQRLDLFRQDQVLSGDFLNGTEANCVYALS